MVWCDSRRQATRPAYHREDDRKNIGAAKLDDIQYFFSRDGLYAVLILATGANNYDLLKKAIAGRFGDEPMKDKNEGAIPLVVRAECRKTV